VQRVDAVFSPWLACENYSIFHFKNYIAAYIDIITIVIRIAL